jgi:hypothetical protein
MSQYVVSKMVPNHETRWSEVRPSDVRPTDAGRPQAPSFPYRELHLDTSQCPIAATQSTELYSPLYSTTPTAMAELDQRTDDYHPKDALGDAIKATLGSLHSLGKHHWHFWYALRKIWREYTGRQSETDCLRSCHGWSVHVQQGRRRKPQKEGRLVQQRDRRRLRRLNAWFEMYVALRLWIPRALGRQSVLT